MRDSSDTGQKRILAKTIDSIASRRKAPWSMYVVLLLLYTAATITVHIVSQSQSVLRIADAVIPLPTFAGVFSSLANICIIFLAVYYGTLGFYTAMAIILFQFPLLISRIILHHNVSVLPGLFSNLLTIVAIVVIYLNNMNVQKYQARLRDQAVTDILTGLPNRFACSELVNELIRRNTPFAAVTIDINDFKMINDTMGFDGGNRVLKEIASRWKNIADTGTSGTLDFITRTSGDEFVLVIRNYHTDEEIVSTIRKYETVLEEKLTIDDCDFYVTASFGYAEFPVDAQEKNALFSYATDAMNEVKRVNSSEHIRRFSAELLKKLNTHEVENMVRTAIENDTIFFNLQPQYDMSHRLRGFEALARMKDADGKMVSPGVFIPAAEKMGLIDKVDGIVFRKSALFFGDLIRKTGADITLSINASVRHLMKNNFIDEIKEILKSSGIPAEQLEIEITESIMIESAEKALSCINEIREMGVKVAIDDFGTGYSSLSYLNSFPANLLKIDKSFIDKMNTSDSSKQYVAAIISIGHIMGFDVISEGVEETEQLDTLRDIGCDYIQGFIWGRPLPQEEAEKVVMEQFG